MHRVSNQIPNLLDSLLPTNHELLSHRQNVASSCMLNKTLNGMCSDELTVIDPFDVNTFDKNQNTTPYMLEIPKFIISVYFSRRFFFHANIYMQKFKCSMNRHFAAQLPTYCPCQIDPKQDSLTSTLLRSLCTVLVSGGKGSKNKNIQLFQISLFVEQFN